MMHSHARILKDICVFVACFTAIVASAGEIREERSSANNAKSLLSDNKAERAKALEQLQGQYLETSKALSTLLQEAATKYRADRRYHSPLHCAILAVDAWHILNADAVLLSIVDYEVDVTSLPLGMDVAGDFLYPAARALVRLRVEPRKIVEEIKGAKSPTQVRILTWLLINRADTSECPKRLLENAVKTTSGLQKQNLEKSIELLEHPSDVLPPPSKPAR